MTTDTGLRQQERVVNTELARLLRERCSLNAEAELSVSGRYPDILVGGLTCPVILETEFAPARSVDDDALAKLGLPINGIPTGITFAVTLPADLRSIRQSDLYDRLASSTFAWRDWYLDATSGSLLRGGFADLCEHVRRAEPPTDDLARAVEILERGAIDAGSIIASNPVSLTRVAGVFDRDPGEEVANTAALMVINALVFHGRLSSASLETPVPPLPHDALNYGRALTSAWYEILLRDYWPIFRTAYDVLNALAPSDSHRFALACSEVADALAAVTATVRHDLAGQVFNRLVADRKFLAAFYTSIPAATMLAGLALAPERWSDVDWSDIETLRRFQVLDPACGSGTLLVSSYKQVVQNHRERHPDPSSVRNELHKTLVENSIGGADVVDAGIHLTASSLAAMVPDVTFEQMKLHVLPLDVDPVDGPRLGSLDWLSSDQVQTMFSGVGEQVGSLSGITSTVVERPTPALVIANPPYRRHESATGEGEYRNKVFGHLPLTRGSQLSTRLSSMLSGTPGNQIAGLASAFVALSDTLIEPDGRLAFVLPATAMSGSSWESVRNMLACKYEVETVISSHDANRPHMSYDTEIAEVLVVARKNSATAPSSGRARFVNLRRRPSNETEAIAVVNAIRRQDRAAVIAADQPPVGGTPLMLGNDEWGSAVEAPIDSGAWLASRWLNAECAQFMYSLVNGVLWDVGATSHIAELSILPIEEFYSISPHHRQIRSRSAPFEIVERWSATDRFPALWHYAESTHSKLAAVPNANLRLKPDRDHAATWKHAGTLHVTPDVRTTSQPISAVTTTIQSLGVRSWYSLRLKGGNDDRPKAREIAASLWLNSTLGMLCHSSYAGRSQQGRSTGSRTMLRTLPTLDVRALEGWQLDAAERIFSEFRNVPFEPFYRCAADTNRIRLDDMLVRDVLGVGDGGIEAVARLRQLLAREPSIYGNKAPVLA